MSGPDAFAGVWRPGSGTQWVRWGMSWDEFKAQDRTYFDQGLRVTSLAIRDGRYAAVWRPGAGAQWIRPGMSGDEFKAQDTTYFDQGLRVTSMAIENGKIAAVWRPGTGAQWVRGGMSWDEFKAQDTTYFAQGLRVTSLASRTGGTAVWRPGTGTQWVRGGMSFGDFAGAGPDVLRPGPAHHSLVIERRAVRGGVAAGLGHAVVELAAGRRRLQDRGHGLLRTRAQDRPVSSSRTTRSAPTGTRGPAACRTRWGRATTTRRLAQRRARRSHSTSPCPPAPTIRAARGGTVEWLQENLTATYNPNLPSGPGNMPFPAGSLQNWGNAVRIRHAGGFTSWYFHIQANGVLVNVGDEVTRGRQSPRSGNTAARPAPHLHFQVQADSTDWGQSVAHTFGDDCEQPAGGATVTSDNAT